MENKQVILASRPSGWVSLDNFTVTEGEVVASHFEGIAEGDHVTGMLGWENYSICDGSLLRKLPQSSAPLSWHLGILGMPGMTAYVGLMKIAEAKAEDQVFVSSTPAA